MTSPRGTQAVELPLEPRARNPGDLLDAFDRRGAVGHLDDQLGVFLGVELLEDGVQGLVPRRPRRETRRSSSPAAGRDPCQRDDPWAWSPDAPLPSDAGDQDSTRSGIAFPDGHAALRTSRHHTWPRSSERPSRVPSVRHQTTSDHPVRVPRDASNRRPARAACRLPGAGSWSDSRSSVDCKRRAA